jgi:hypothetical protein
MSRTRWPGVFPAKLIRPLLFLRRQLAVQKALLQFGVFGDCKERQVEAPIEVRPVWAEVVNEKAVEALHDFQTVIRTGSS